MATITWWSDSQIKNGVNALINWSAQVCHDFLGRAFLIYWLFFLMLGFNCMGKEVENHIWWPQTWSLTQTVHPSRREKKILMKAIVFRILLRNLSKLNSLASEINNGCIWPKASYQKLPCDIMLYEIFRLELSIYVLSSKFSNIISDGISNNLFPSMQSGSNAISEAGSKYCHIILIAFNLINT